MSMHVIVTTRARASFAALSLLMLPCVWIQSAQAQNPPATPVETNPQGPILAPTYRIAVEDSIDVSVSVLDGLGATVANRSFTVLSDGTADVPFLGETRVVGLTLAELKRKIRTIAAKNYERPEVTLVVTKRSQLTVNVFGVLASRGKLPLRENWHVRDVIAAAGGLPTDRYDFLEASLLRKRTGEVIPIDLQRLLGENDRTQDLTIESDDTLFVRELDSSRTTIQVIGEVTKPGPVVLPRSRSVLDVLQAAGGPTERASLSQVTIERNGKSMVFDMTDYRKTGKEPAEKLQMGDRLVIPQNRMEYYIYGAAPRPGPQIYPEDRKITVYQAIALAGGQTNGAELKKTRLIRRNPDGSTKYTAVVNVEKMLKNADFSGDIPVEPGDSLYIPAASGRKGVSYQEVLAYITGFYTLTQIFRRL